MVCRIYPSEEDLRRAYRQFPIDPKDYDLLGFRYQAKFYFEILQSKLPLSQNKYYFNLCEFLKQLIHAFVGKLKDRCFCWFPSHHFAPLKGTPTWHLHTNLCTFG